MEPNHNISTSKPQSLEDIDKSRDFDHEEANNKNKMTKYAKMMANAKEIKHQIVDKLDNHINKDKPIVDTERVRKWVSCTYINGKSLLKWLITVLNVIIELIQAVLAQEAAEGIINKAYYAKLCVISSCICLMMSIFDIVYEAKEGKVKLKRKGNWVWFYYPGKHGKMFGSFWLGFGLISSVMQFVVNLYGYVSKKPGFVRFDYLPLLLSVCFLIASFGNGKRLMFGVVKCSEKHGEYVIEGRFVHGSWVFECPTCKLEGLV